MNKNNNSGPLFLLGLLIGAAIAISLTPVDGKKLRNASSKKGKRLFEDFKDKYNDVEENTLKPNWEILKARGEKFWNSAEDKWEEMSPKVSKFAKQRKEDLEDKASGLRKFFNK